MGFVSTVAKRGLMKYRPARMTCSCNPLWPPLVIKASASWYMLWPSISLPAISPVVSGLPSFVVTTPTMLSGISRTSSVVTLKSAELMR